MLPETPSENLPSTWFWQQMLKRKKYFHPSAVISCFSSSYREGLGGNKLKPTLDGGKKKGSWKARLLPGHFLSRYRKCQTFVAIGWRCWEYNHVNCDNWRHWRKAQLKNFQKSKGSQNSKQATHTLLSHRRNCNQRKSCTRSGLGLLSRSPKNPHICGCPLCQTKF